MVRKAMNLMKQINSYIDSVFHNQNALLEEVISSIEENGMPSISVSPSSALIVTDNVLAGGSVADQGAKPKRYTELMKKFNETVANHPQLDYSNR